MQRESFFFRREWKTAIAHLPKDVRKEVCLAIVDYALGDPAAELSPMAKVAFSMIEPLIEKDLAKVDHMRSIAVKGGRARYAQKTQSNGLADGLADGRTSDEKEEKKAKEEIPFLPPTPPIYPKEEKEKKEETPSRPPSAPIDPGKFRLESTSPADETQTKPKKNPLDPASLPQGFVAFWNVYPSRRRADKQKCLKKWKDNGLEAQASAIIADVRKRKNSDDWTREGGQYIPLSSTYLNQTRWDCAEIPQTAAFGGKPDSPVAEKLSPEEICRRRREAYFAEERRRNMLIYGKEAYRDADADDEFQETF